MNASKPSHQSKGLGGSIGCRYKNFSWHLKGFPNVVTWGQQYNIGDKPTVILCTNFNHHVGTPKQKQGTLSDQMYKIFGLSSGLPYSNMVYSMEKNKVKMRLVLLFR